MILRSMQQEDFAEVAKLESEIFSEPWSEESFKKAATCPENLYLSQFPYLLSAIKS